MKMKSASVCTSKRLLDFEVAVCSFGKILSSIPEGKGITISDHSTENLYIGLLTTGYRVGCWGSSLVRCGGCRKWGRTRIYRLRRFAFRLSINRKGGARMSARPVQATGSRP